MPTQIECQEQSLRMKELERRCNTYEIHLTTVKVSLGKAETRLAELEDQQECCTATVRSLQAWKNKALGYLGALGIVTMYLIESFRDHFWGR